MIQEYQQGHRTAKPELKWVLMGSCPVTHHAARPRNPLEFSGQSSSEENVAPSDGSTNIHIHTNCMYMYIYASKNKRILKLCHILKCVFMYKRNKH